MCKRYYRVCRAACLVLSVAAVSACSKSDIGDLQSYVKEVNARQTPRVESLPEFVPYDTFLYHAQEFRDPFTAPVDDAVTTVAQVNDNGIHPVNGRRKEPLEGFSLDSLRMVGTLHRDTETWALVRSASGAIHRVKSGNYVGRNHGKIIGVSEHSVNVSEIISDGLGGWIERAASLALKE